MSHKPIMIMAGGTGGHVYPALAVANYLQQQGIPLLWLGTAKGLEAKVVPAQGYQLLTINISGLRGKGFIKWLFAPFIVLIALLQTIIILVRRRPAAVLGMGGFVGGPGGVAAWLMRIPLCIHEQNAIAGLTNCLLAPFSHTVMAAFPNAFKKSLVVHITGNPVRDEILNVQTVKSQTKPQTESNIRLLVLGGSLGARVLNEIIPETLAILPDDVKFGVRHQTGEKLFNEAELRYKSFSITAELVPFIDDMAEAYSWADVVICRAGALTIAELAAVGIASILVPYPYAVDDHQTANARYLSDSGGAIICQQSELTKEKLANCLCELFRSRHRLQEMANVAKAQSKPQATRQVSELCMEAAYA